MNYVNHDQIDLQHFFICLSVILINSVFKIDKNYYPQVYLEKCKFVFKEPKLSNYITDDINTSSDDSVRKILLILIKKILMNKYKKPLLIETKVNLFILRVSFKS